MPDTSLQHDPHAEEADDHTSVGDLIELSLVPLVETVHSEPSGDAPPMLEWQADDVDWMTLRTARYSRAWRVAALALGLKPLKDIRRRLSGLGRRSEERAYLAMKTVIANNLTSEADPDRLSFVKNAENDGRRVDPSKKSTERVLDVVAFVDFIQGRGVNVHPRMAGIVQEIAEPKAAKAEGPVAFDLDQAPSGEASSIKESLTIGLLMMYLRDLTKRRAAPPPGLLKGANDDINAQELAATLQAFVSERIDRDGRHAMPTTGASITTLRKTPGRSEAPLRRHKRRVGHRSRYKILVTTISLWSLTTGKGARLNTESMSNNGQRGLEHGAHQTLPQEAGSNARVALWFQRLIVGGGSVSYSLSRLSENSSG